MKSTPFTCYCDSGKKVRIAGCSAATNRLSPQPLPSCPRCRSAVLQSQRSPPTGASSLGAPPTAPCADVNRGVASSTGGCATGWLEPKRSVLRRCRLCYQAERGAGGAPDAGPLPFARREHLSHGLAPKGARLTHRKALPGGVARTRSQRRGHSADAGCLTPQQEDSLRCRHTQDHHQSTRERRGGAVRRASA